MIEKFRPLGDRALVKRIDEAEMTPSGIIIPDAAKEKGQKGLILAVGIGRKDKDGSMAAMAVSAGDVIYFGKYAGTEVDEKHLIIREDEILGIVEK